jgi:DNA-binding LacI/PurR family transcriptional regulator/signal transduction histidine kinase
MSDQSTPIPTRSQRFPARPWTVGLLVGSAEDKYENAMLRGISDVVRPAGANLICFTSGALRSYHGFEAQRNVLYDLVNAGNVDGLIISGTLAHSVSRADMAALCQHYQPLPLISVALHLDNMTSIMTDSRSSMQAVVEHLIGTHHYQRIAFIRGPRGQQEAEERYHAYIYVLTQHGRSIEPDLVLDGDFTHESGAAVLRALLDRAGVCCDAIVAANDAMALGALEVLRAKGLRVPEDVALTGFDDTEDGRFSVPPLTTVRQSAYLQGRQAGRAMLSRLQGVETATCTIMPSALIVRQSCGCAEQSVALAAAPDALTFAEYDGSWTNQRDTIGVTLAGAAPLLPYDLAVDWTQRLFEAFVVEVVEDRSGVFLAILADLILLSQSADDDGSVWHNILSALRAVLLPMLTETGRAAQAENLWQQARTLIGESARLRQARLRVQTEQRAAILREISEAMVTSFYLADVLDVIAWELPRLNVSACYLSLFDNSGQPVEQARLVLAYDSQGRQILPRDGERFPAKQLVPPERLRCATPYTLVVEALYSKEERLGFVLFEVDAPSSSICGALRGQLSSALQGVMLLEQRRQIEAELQQHQNHLEQLVEARTLAVSEANTQLQQKIVERSQAEEALRESEAISAAVAHIARQLLEAADWREQIQAVLERLGQVSNATHVYVFEHHLGASGEMLTSQRYEWVLAGFQSELDDPRLQNMPVYQAELDDWYEPLARGEPFYNTSLGFSEHWSESLNQRGIKTLLDVPVFVDGRWWGIIGFDDCVNELAWSQVEINALRTAADILGAAIQRQRADEERERLIAELEARNTELERFTYTVSHDLKAPLITIRGFLGFVEQDARAGSWERLDEDMARIVEATDKMRRLLDELLELSRIGRMMNPPEDVAFAAIVQDALQLVQGRLAARNVQVEVAAQLPTVHGDRARLVEVVQNLVDNACKFMGDQSEPRITIGQRGIDREGKPILFVQDNGIGIDPQYHERIFELFNKLNPRLEGTGIGLALVKRIIEVHGGRIWVESAGANKGTTFFFTLQHHPASSVRSTG